MNIKIAYQSSSMKREVFSDSKGVQFAVLETFYYENSNNYFAVYSHLLREGEKNNPDAFTTENYFEARASLELLLARSERSHTFLGRLVNVFS